jgi:hypothetical protein
VAGAFHNDIRLHAEQSTQIIHDADGVLIRPQDAGAARAVKNAGYPVQLILSLKSGKYMIGNCAEAN